MLNRTESSTKEPISCSNRNQNSIKNNRRAGRVARNIIVFLILILSLAGFFGYRYVSDAVGAKDVKSTKFISVLKFLKIQVAVTSVQLFGISWCH